MSITTVGIQYEKSYVNPLKTVFDILKTIKVRITKSWQRMMSIDFDEKIGLFPYPFKN